MPRQARIAVADTIYHVINRANGRARIFDRDGDYRQFESLIQEAKDLTGMRILSYCVMPNHFHFALYPRTDADLAAFMGWLTTTHVRKYRTWTQTVGYGHLYQDRYKSFPVETNEYAVALVRYIEQNPLRARLVRRAEQWRWSSLWRRERGSEEEQRMLDDLPVELPHDYLHFVNEVMDDEPLQTIRYSVNKGKPFGTDDWTEQAIERFGLGHTLRTPGRPRKR